MSSIIHTKAEIQKLIKLYNKLQADAKLANTEESAHKLAQAEKLVSQINTLQQAISKTKASKDAEQAKNKKSTATKPPKPTVHKSATEEKRIELEQRINRIEEAQQKTRAKIEQLNVAKTKLSRLQVEAEKNVANQCFNKEQHIQAQEWAKLTEQLQTKETQYQAIRKELDIVRQQTHKYSEVLRKERDTAVEKQKILEKEKMNLLRCGNDYGFLKGLLTGLGLGILSIIIFILLIFKTPLLDEMVCQTSGSNSNPSKVTNVQVFPETDETTTTP
ncbi:MAG: hypothetical protein DRQ49_11430 [Gammaproteobacteria bacterium]|nr:MAG: hypothetical protein DRQ49_11430 [Gammaproteobacteria bacterium]RKZ73177.1 MAG: hypothetical protein DRQ57_15205 [Gammaproteobacteria bacterium]